MFIDIGKLKLTSGQKEKWEFKEELSTITLGEDKVEFSGPADIIINAVNSEGNIVVSGKVKAMVILTCTRCLEKFKLELETSFDREYEPVEGHKGHTDSLPQDEEEILSVKGDKIDLADVIQESILLELPMKHICSEKCKGLCNQCGKNLNTETCSCEKDDIDPRLEALKDFFK